MANVQKRPDQASNPELIAFLTSGAMRFRSGAMFCGIIFQSAASRGAGNAKDRFAKHLPTRLEAQGLDLWMRRHGHDVLVASWPSLCCAFR
jgi:hypothetical protein